MASASCRPLLAVPTITCSCTRFVAAMMISRQVLKRSSCQLAASSGCCQRPRLTLEVLPHDLHDQAALVEPRDDAVCDGAREHEVLRPLHGVGQRRRARRVRRARLHRPRRVRAQGRGAHIGAAAAGGGGEGWRGRGGVRMGERPARCSDSARGGACGARRAHAPPAAHLAGPGPRAENGRAPRLCMAAQCAASLWRSGLR